MFADSQLSHRACATAGADREALALAYERVRARSMALAAPLSAEDQGVQSMADASPTKWHLAHTSWFFEAVVLGPHAGGYQPFDAGFSRLFNSYYESLGPRHPRPQRGLLTRPDLATVHAYRAHVDAAMGAFILRGDAATRRRGPPPMPWWRWGCNTSSNTRS